MFKSIKSNLAKKFPSLFKQTKAEQTIPWAILEKDLEEAKVAVVTAGGVHLKSDTPFDISAPNGDPEFRKIPTNINEFEISSPCYDTTNAKQDINIMIPFKALRRTLDEKLIGSISENFYSFSGHPRGPLLEMLKNETVVQVAYELIEQNVDLVILTPGCALCQNALGIVQRTLESAGIVTVSISLSLDVSKEFKTPRSLFLKYPAGHPFGEPEYEEQHYQILKDCLKLALEATEPGTLIQSDYRWRRTEF